MIERPKNVLETHYYSKYIDQAPGEDLIPSLKESKIALEQAIRGIKANKESFQYAANKWTIKQVVQHITDTERILHHRALRFARKDNTPLQAYDENFYAENDNTENLNLNQLIEEFSTMRKSIIQLFEMMRLDSLDFEGEASGLKMSPRMLGWIISGHSMHHLSVLKTKYL